MSGICDTCKRKPCPAEGEGYRCCDFYEGGETRYEKMFGTPERAARTMAQTFITCNNSRKQCKGCPFSDASACPNDDSEAALLEWLRGDA